MQTEKPVWKPEAQQYLDKAPFFVRGLARRKVEKAAAAAGVKEIDKAFVEAVRQKES